MVVDASPVQIPPRERQVLTLIANGFSEQQVARALHVTVNTVKTFSRRARQRLGAATTVHAVTLAYRSGALPLHPVAAPHPWQGVNGQGVTCHYPGCTLTHDQHVPGRVRGWLRR